MTDRLKSPDMLQSVWLGVGWLGLALLIYLSLVPRPPGGSFNHGDKLAHVLAYAVLMFWWAQWLVNRSARAGLAAALMALGVALEYAQGLTGWRSFDYLDMLANAAGILSGWLIASRAPNVLVLINHWKTQEP